MDNRLREIMQYGFLIFENTETQYVLQKTSTPTDNSENVDESGGNCSDRAWFDSFDEALGFAERYILAKKGPKWKIDLYVSHQFGPKVHDLGTTKNMQRIKAESVAKDAAEDFVSETYKVKEVKSWEVKIRPANDQ